MAMSCRYVAQSCARQLRAAPSFNSSAHMFRVSITTRRYNSTEAAAPANPKIAEIVDQISRLTLLETADLVSSLKVRLYERWLGVTWAFVFRAFANSNVHRASLTSPTCPLEASPLLPLLL